mgnify:CR=1 FL=1
MRRTGKLCRDVGVDEPPGRLYAGNKLAGVGTEAKWESQLKKGVQIRQDGRQANWPVEVLPKGVIMVDALIPGYQGLTDWTQVRVPSDAVEWD